MKLSVPFNWDAKLIDGLQEGNYPVSDLYGSLPEDLIGSGRPGVFIPATNSRRMASGAVKHLHAAGYKFTYLLNSPCLDNLEYTRACNNNIDEVRAIYASLKNESDLYKLSDAFGTRMYNPCWFDHPMCALFSTGSRNVDLDTFMDLEFTPDVISSFKNPIYAGTASVCAAPPQCTSLWNQIFCGTA